MLLFEMEVGAARGWRRRVYCTIIRSISNQGTVLYGIHTTYMLHPLSCLERKSSPPGPSYESTAACRKAAGSRFLACVCYNTVLNVSKKNTPLSCRSVSRSPYCNTPRSSALQVQQFGCNSSLHGTCPAPAALKCASCRSSSCPCLLQSLHRNQLLPSTMLSCRSERCGRRHSEEEKVAAEAAWQEERAVVVVVVEVAGRTRWHGWLRGRRRVCVRAPTRSPTAAPSSWRACPAIAACRLG